MCVCVFACVFVCVCVCGYVRMHTFVCVRAFACERLRACVFVRACVRFGLRVMQIKNLRARANSRLIHLLCSALLAICYIILGCEIKTGHHNTPSYILNCL